MATEYREDGDSDRDRHDSPDYSLGAELNDRTKDQLGLAEGYNLVRYNNSVLEEADGVLILTPDNDFDSIRRFLSDRLEPGQDVIMPSHFVGSVSAELMENGYDAEESIVASTRTNIEGDGARYIRVSF